MQIMEKTEITIIGAGVIGLAAAYELSKIYKDIVVIEQESTFGAQTSSRNSEVIHAGLYYPKESLKTKTCIEGKRLIYEFCSQNNIPHNKIGKLIVAIAENEVKDLEGLFKRGQDNGVTDLSFLSRVELNSLEPQVRAKAAIYSPSTGILDSHSLMQNLIQAFKSRNGQIAYNTQLLGIDKVRDGYKLSVEDKREGVFEFTTRILINAAGLFSDKVAAMLGLTQDTYKLKYCKGDYFRVHHSKSKFINRLIYPVPKEEGRGLGIHATLDLSGGLRLGPDDEYVEKLDYNIDGSKRGIFYESVRKFLPFIQLEDLNPDMAGIRPKLQGAKETFRDFIIKDESPSGFPGLINLIGIESPGLTSCLSIARIVKEAVNRI